MNKQQLAFKIWESANRMRSKIEANEYKDYILGFIFIFAGAIAWWWCVTYFIDKVRAHFNLRSMYLINRVIGVIILLFAIVGIVTGITNLLSA